MIKKCSKCDKIYEDGVQVLAVFERPTRFYCEACKTYTLPTYYSVPKPTSLVKLSNGEMAVFAACYAAALAIPDCSEKDCLGYAILEALKVKEFSEHIEKKFGKDSDVHQVFKQIIGE